MRPPARTWPTTLRCAVGLVAALLASPPAAAQDASVDAGLDAALDAPAPRDPTVAGLEALVAGGLDPAVSPRALFDVDLADEAAVQVEAVRARALLSALAPPLDAGAAPRGHARAVAAPDDASLAAAIDALDPSRWSARVAVDRARLAFYELPRARRDALLAEHARRVEASRPRESADARRAREVEAEHQRALAAARAARSEAERMVSEELARLIGVQGRVEAFSRRLRSDRVSIGARRDAVLGWQRRARAAAEGAAADDLYDAIRARLRASRDDLDAALDALGDDDSAVPALGRDPLGELPADIPRGDAKARRALVDRQIAAARSAELALRSDRAAALLDEVDVLNRERLELLPRLSSQKRAAITGFTDEGWEQARSEARQLALILRYHRQTAGRWVESLRRGGARGASPWGVAVVLVPWLALLYAFLWWRRRSGALIALVRKRVAADERRERRTTHSNARKALRLLAGVHRPLEALAFFGATLSLLPASTRGLLEARLLATVIGWSLGGAFVVDAINALAGGGTVPATPASEVVDRLRLRSLRLAGRVTVAIVLVLMLSARLVGEGTVYSWVLSSCWLAAVPVLLVVVRWWREQVFERVERARKKSPLQAWVLAHRHGWQSFLAATLGAVQLFTVGAAKAATNWLAGFNLARRAHAYVFKRELDRLAQGRTHVATAALRAGAFDSLSPDELAVERAPSPADEAQARLVERARRGEGGVVAVVAPRGLGKSSLLRAVQAAEPAALRVSCVERPSLAALRAAAPEGALPALVLLDDAQALVRPVIGGLARFDEVVSFARDGGAATLWVVAVDAALWPFLSRARDARPIFDEVIVLRPWTEDQIGALLAARSARAAVDPSFEGLLEALPPTADEVDRHDALAARREAYVRMLWDHVGGNPGIALEVWRSSLVEDAEGNVLVRPLQVPDVVELEALPDASLFILRAVLQLAPARAEEVARMTQLTEAQVVSAIRFAEARGYLGASGPGVRVTWRWLRPVAHLLERRHLLVNP